MLMNFGNYIFVLVPGCNQATPEIEALLPLMLRGSRERWTVV